jgi:hypothetical protein
MWKQYIAIKPEGYRSSQFAHHYKVWSKRVNPVMHMNHKSQYRYRSEQNITK